MRNVKNTSNPNFKDLVGRVGELTVMDNGRFAFEFIDRDGSKKMLSSGIKGRLGDPDDVRSKEVNIITNNSTYDFTKLENYLEESKLFGHTYGASIDEQIANASGCVGPSVGEQQFDQQMER